MAQAMRLQARCQGHSTPVPKTRDTWVVVGMWLAVRELPELPFFLPLVDAVTGEKLEASLPLKAMMAALNPRYTPRAEILLHLRVVQRVDAMGRLDGELRYVCTDIANSYGMGDTGYKWIHYQSDADHTHCAAQRSPGSIAVQGAWLTLRSSRACLPLLLWCQSQGHPGVLRHVENHAEPSGT